jgi:Tfp pilus assembly protein PilN
MAQTIDPLVDEELEQSEETGQSPRIVIWLVVLSLLGLMVPMFLVRAMIQDQTTKVKADVAKVEQDLTDLSKPSSEQNALQDQLLNARTELDTLDTLQTDLTTNYINWPAIMTAIGNYGSAQMQITSLSQAANQILINGQAENETVVMSYARMLEETSLFSRVVVQSMALKMLPTPTPQPTATPPAETPTPGAATVSAPTPTNPAPIVEFVILVELSVDQGSGS